MTLDKIGHVDLTHDTKGLQRAMRIPLRVTVAPNGARRLKQHHPKIPITLNEIVDCAEHCHAAGAQDIHLHVRDADGQHSLSTDIYQRTLSAIAERVPTMTIQITTESAGQFDVAAQFDLLKSLRPRAASISVREILRSPDLVKPLYHFAAEAEIIVQHILYDQDDLTQLRRLLNIGDIPTHLRDVLLVFGAYNPPVLAQPTEVASFHKALAGEFPDWTVCAFGPHENAVAAEAMRLGGHVRIGFENNIQRPDGTPATDNAENIALAISTAKKLSRPLMRKDTGS